MSLSDLIKLKDEQLSFEGELTSVVLSDEGGTITGKGDATLYGAVYLTYNLTPNPKIAGQGVMTGNASAIVVNSEKGIEVAESNWIAPTNAFLSAAGPAPRHPGKGG